MSWLMVRVYSVLLLVPYPCTWEARFTRTPRISLTSFRTRRTCWTTLPLGTLERYQWATS